MLNAVLQLSAMCPPDSPQDWAFGLENLVPPSRSVEMAVPKASDVNMDPRASLPPPKVCHLGVCHGRPIAFRKNGNCSIDGFGFPNYFAGVGAKSIGVQILHISLDERSTHPGERGSLTHTFAYLLHDSSLLGGGMVDPECGVSHGLVWTAILFYGFGPFWVLGSGCGSTGERLLLVGFVKSGSDKTSSPGAH